MAIKYNEEDGMIRVTGYENVLVRAAAKAVGLDPKKWLIKALTDHAKEVIKEEDSYGYGGTDADDGDDQKSNKLRSTRRTVAHKGTRKRS